MMTFDFFSVLFVDGQHLDSESGVNNSKSDTDLLSIASDFYLRAYYIGLCNRRSTNCSGLRAGE